MAWSQAVGLCVRTKPLRSALKSRLPSLPASSGLCVPFALGQRRPNSPGTARLRMTFLPRLLAGEDRACLRSVCRKVCADGIQREGQQ